jgi:O-antigen/teichoic acid export membrane protein
VNSVVTVVVVFVTAAMYPALALWISEDFAQRAVGPGILLAIAIWMNSLAMVPSAFLQGIGRPDVTAKIHLMQLVPHVIVLWLSVKAFGATGAAMAMVLVTLFDTVLLMCFARMNLSRMPSFWGSICWIAMAALVGVNFSALSNFAFPAIAILGIATLAWALKQSPELLAAMRQLSARADTPSA